MIATAQFTMLDGLYDYYNSELFDGKLKSCMINMSRKRRANGFFMSRNWKNTAKEVQQEIHEISLNPDYLDRPEIAWHATLVHEMVHLWQYDYGKPSRSGYHNRQWAHKMEELGLIPSSTGEAGGKKTGQNMTHYIPPTGLFIEAFNRLKEKRLKYVPLSLLETGKNKTSGKNANKTKYECPCGNNVWGKPGMHIICTACGEEFGQTEQNI
jgi:predicted SprT family Zn-dependent metalloprotease